MKIREEVARIVERVTLCARGGCLGKVVGYAHLLPHQILFQSDDRDLSMSHLLRQAHEGDFHVAV